MFGRNARIIFILLLTVLHFLKNFANAEISIPMHFSLHHGCSGSACPYYILAEGIIKEDTPKKFLNFVKTVKEGKPTVYFNSSGGNLSAGLELGRAIRHLGLDTFVGGPYESFTGVKQPDKILVEQGICFSACAYAFLGGVTREIDTKGLFGLHQFRSQRSNKNDKGEASTQSG